jgi:hypothetical protein
MSLPDAVDAREREGGTMTRLRADHWLIGGSAMFAIGAIVTNDDGAFAVAYALAIFAWLLKGGTAE